MWPVWLPLVARVVQPEGDEVLRDVHIGHIGQKIFRMAGRSIRSE
ncbi:MULTISPECIES: hypothetical protein [Streptomyces]|jgi:hypothetical protein|uniref:Uncharacterized protein n=1 Tax=Streptomyces sp. 900129855 TaxID=3155129 RepID=A0ABV2ZAR5_9ACTN